MRSGAGRRWVPLALVALAFAVRALPWREVFAVGHVIPPDGDAWYHLRRISVAVFEAPRFLDFDRYLHFPEGARPIWPPLFDRLVAGALAPWVPPLGQGGLVRLERLAMWVPPVLGALAVGLTGRIAQRHFGAHCGWLAAGVLAVLSGHFWYSQVGYLDHHVAVGTVAVALLGAGLALLAALEQPGAGERGWPAALGVGGLSALALLLWPGALLHVGLVALGLLASALARASQDAARALALRLAVGHALAAAIVAPFALGNSWPQWGAASPVVLSRFQPWGFACAAAVLGGSARLWSTTWAGRSRGRRAASFAVVAALAAASSLWLVPGLAQGAGDAWRWMTRREAFQAVVAESQPLLVDGGRFTAWIALVRLSAFSLLLPLAIGWLAVRTRRAPDATRVRLVLWFAGGLFVMALLQRRFFHSAAIGLALVLALAMRTLWRDAARTAHPAAARALLVGVLVAGLAPTFEPYVRPLANEWRVARGQKIHVSASFAAAIAAQEMAEALRERTPPTSGWLDGGAPEYGVLAPWPLGHLIEYVGRRPTLVTNFGDDLGEDAFAFAQHALASPESESLAGMRARRLRYVVVQRDAGFLAVRPPRDALLRALYERDGSAPAPDDPRGAALPAVLHYRPLYETRGLDPRQPGRRPLYKIFERVEGARLEGRAAPGARLELSLDLVLPSGRHLTYRNDVRADPTGAWQVRFPHATSGGPPGVRVAPQVRLVCGDEVAEVAVPEAAVAEGRVVRAPALCLRPAGSE